MCNKYFFNLKYFFKSFVLFKIDFPVVIVTILTFYLIISTSQYLILYSWNYDIIDNRFFYYLIIMTLYLQFTFYLIIMT